MRRNNTVQTTKLNPKGEKASESGSTKNQADGSYSVVPLSNMYSDADRLDGMAAMQYTLNLTS